MKKKIIYILTIILGIAFIFSGHALASKNMPNTQQNDVTLYKAEVVSATEKDDYIVFDFFFTDGKDENRHTAIQQDTQISNPVKAGDIVYVTKSTDNSGYSYVFQDFFRLNTIIYLAIFFLILVIIFGRTKGVNTIISLAFTLLSLFYVFLPSVLSGHNIYLWGAICCIAIVIFVLIIVHGLNKKSLASGLGTVLGLSFAWIIMQVSSDFFHFTGMTSEDAMYLKFNTFGLTIDIKAIFFTTIIIGALGAVMDVAMSIATSLYEVKQLKPEVSTKELIKSGFEIGKDILGTMTNTLVLAYVGSGFLTIIVIVAVNSNLIQILNREFLIAQIFEPLIGSFGIVATLPITSVIAAYLLNHSWKNWKTKFSNKKQAITKS